MKGFEIQINDEEPIVVATDRKMFILINCFSETYCDFNATGVNNAFQRLSWIVGRKLLLGDKIKIKVIETKFSSEYSKPIIETSRDELKKLYEKRKLYLKEKGLLK